MLGFGFNKDKTRAAAENYVRQGRITNAIAEYDKILKQDPSDLTVLNTVGDLYASLKRFEEAVTFFRQVGEKYASEGFVPRAIALYKKIVKLAPEDMEFVIKLGELYTQQGLYNDARSQFMLAAENHERGARIGEAIKCYQRILDLDPDNGAVLGRMAKLQKKAGNADEAAKLLYTSAQALRSRGQLDAADEALVSLLSLDAHHQPALLLRAEIAFEREDLISASAIVHRIEHLEQNVPALTLLLRCHLTTENLAEAEPVARTLMIEHGAPTALFAVTDRLFHDSPEHAIELYKEFAARMIEADHTAFVSHLAQSVDLLRDKPELLKDVDDLLTQAGAQQERVMLLELIARHEETVGDAEKALHAYKTLCELAPEDPSYAQRCRQLVLQVGGAAAEVISADAAAASERLPEAPPPFADAHIEPPPSFAPATETITFDIPAPADDSFAPPAFAIAAPEPVASKEAPAVVFPPSHGADAIPEFDLSIVEFDVSSPDSAPIESFAIDAPPVVETEPVAEALPVTPAAPAVSSPAPADSGAISLDLSQEWRNEAETADLVEEIRFYLSQSMWSEADFACQRLAERAPGNKYLPELQEQVRAALAENGEAAVTELESIDTIEVDAPPSEESFEEAIASAEASFAEVEPELADETADSVDVDEPAPAVEIAKAPVEPPVSVAEPAAIEEPTEAAEAKPAFASEQEAHSFDDFLKDLDESLEEDFTLDAEPAPAIAETPSIAVPPVVAPEPVTAEAVIAAPQPVATPAPFVAEPAAVAEPLIAEEEPNGLLNELFEEFKGEMGEDSSAEDDDPETRYNLACAFREMGLLDEAIGELQKVCLAVEHGHDFSQALQAYTWLAHCFVQKGVPEASFRWYQQALTIATDENSRTAIHYEMADAYEAAGLKQEALHHFMQVYASNIDFRDVGERIQALRS